MQMSKGRRCAICKGTKMLCGRPKCPILEKIRIKSKILPKLSKDIFGSSPSSIFVGSWNYPKVYLGPMVPPIIGDTSEMDRPEVWHGRPLEEIIGFRSSLVRSKDQLDVKIARDPNRRVMLMQDIVMSDRPVDTELFLEKKPRFEIRLSEFSPPHGPSETLKKLDLAQNPHIPRTIDKVHNDDLLATNGISLLYNKGIEVSHISKLLSAGILGEQKNRKFVPTKWSITATDDIISKELMGSLRDNPQISEYLVFHSEDIGNKLVALVMPGIWSFEFMECWLPGSLFSSDDNVPNIISDWEYFNGRKKYADVIAGAYYAGRLPITSYLYDAGRQARCIVIMEVQPSYHTPIGVWRVRTILEDALKQRPLKFDNMDDAVKEVDNFLTLPAQSYIDKSQLLNFTSRQKVLDEWF